MHTFQWNTLNSNWKFLYRFTKPSLIHSPGRVLCPIYLCTSAGDCTTKWILLSVCDRMEVAPPLISWIEWCHLVYTFHLCQWTNTCKLYLHNRAQTCGVLNLGRLENVLTLPMKSHEIVGECLVLWYKWKYILEGIRILAIDLNSNGNVALLIDLDVPKT